MDDGATVVLGLGNVLLSDDGLGVRAVARLAEDARVGPGVTLVDGGTLGLELLSYAAGADRLLVLDAVEIGAAPGTLTRATGADLAELPASSSVHQLGVADMLAALRMMGCPPREVVLLGLQPACLTLGTELTPDVAVALDVLVEAAIGELAAWEAGTREEACTKSGSSQTH